jgi:polyisoprenoid-binding protein YceI
MKTHKNALACLVFLFGSTLFLPARSGQKNQGTEAVYQLDTRKSRLLWEAPRFSHEGYILFNSGTLNLSADGKPARGRFSINMNSMRSTDKTSEAKRKIVDGKLRGNDFFAVAKYPAATMVVNRIVPERAASTYRVSGALTIKNVTRPISFTAVMKEAGSTLTATGSLRISRANWNIVKQPKTASWNPIAGAKDKLMENDIPVTLRLMFVKK